MYSSSGLFKSWLILNSIQITKFSATIKISILFLFKSDLDVFLFSAVGCSTITFTFSPIIFSIISYPIPFDFKGFSLISWFWDTKSEQFVSKSALMNLSPKPCFSFGLKKNANKFAKGTSLLFTFKILYVLNMHQYLMNIILYC